MSEKNYTSKFNFHKHDNFLKNILELRKLISKINDDRQEMKEDFEKLQKIIKALLKEVKKSEGLY